MLSNKRLLKKIKRVIGIAVASSSMVTHSSQFSKACLFNCCRRGRVNNNEVFYDYPLQKSRLYGCLSSYLGGEYVKYNLDKVTGVLHISKLGEMIVTKNWKEHIDKNLVRSIYIEDGFTEIDCWAFAGCSNLTSVRLPESLVKISSYAFMDCSSLCKINDDSNKIPDSVNFIGKGVLWNCRSLHRIIIPEDCYIHGGAFCGCSSLNFVNKIKYIDKDAFLECHNLISHLEFSKEDNYWWHD